MHKPAPTVQRLNGRERLRWQRALDERLIDEIFGRVVRDVPLPANRPVPRAYPTDPTLDSLFAPGA